MYLDKMARASLVNEYQINYEGKIFGIRDKVTQATWMHGVTVGAELNR